MNDFYEFHKDEMSLEFPFRLGIAGAMSSGKSHFTIQLIDNLGSKMYELWKP